MTVDTNVVNNQFSTWTCSQGDFVISTDVSQIDVDMVHHYLCHDSYWATGVTKEMVQRRIHHSLCFGVYTGDTQIGFARFVTDFTMFAFLADVFILPSYRGQGLGKWLMHCMLQHPELQTVQHWTLNTRDAHGLYEQFGYERNPKTTTYMVRQLSS